METKPNSLQDYVQLMTQHQGALRAFIVSLMPGLPDVGDVLQETNLVLWQKRAQFKEGSNFLAWAFTIARYEVMHQRDRVRRNGEQLFSEQLINALSSPPEDSHTDDTKLAALDNCMGKLTSSERELINHRYSAGKSLETLASFQSKSPVSLRVSLFRLRLALKKCIEKQLLKGELA